MFAWLNTTPSGTRRYEGVATCGLALIGLGGCSTLAPVEGQVEGQPEVVVVPDEAPTPVDASEPEMPVTPQGMPPFDGTVYLTPEAITPSSPSDFLAVTAKGMATRETFDRRVDDWVITPSYVFSASYRCGRPNIDVIVNEEFGSQEAAVQALRYAEVVGRLPMGSREAIAELWIHRGYEPAGGGNESILIHTDGLEAEWEYVEEIFVHEAAHTSLDPDFGGAVNASDWAVALEEDGAFISTYARDNPLREDAAESYGAYVVWALNDQLGLFADLASRIEQAMPSRIAYFESLGPQLRPLSSTCATENMSDS